jgi:hypothetical protein
MDVLKEDEVGLYIVSVHRRWHLAVAVSAVAVSKRGV